MKLTQKQKLFQEIVQEAWENAEFKRKLVTNPVATIEKFIGRELNIPEGKKLVVRDQTDASTVYINIPANQLENIELNEGQLEAVAGGNMMSEHNSIGGVLGSDIRPITPIETYNPTFDNLI